jgi:hypothetical protein
VTWLGRVPFRHGAASYVRTSKDVLPRNADDHDSDHSHNRHLCSGTLHHGQSPSQEHRRISLFRWVGLPYEHYDRAALFAQMNDVVFLDGGLHCDPTDGARLRSFRRRLSHADL